MASPTISWANVTIPFDYGFSLSTQKDFNRNEDGSVLTEKHTINIKGSYIATGADGAARYGALIQQSKSFASKVRNGDREATLQMAPLTISNVTGVDATFYDSATLTSISVSEPPEDTAGIQYHEVALTFESYVTPSDPVSLYKLRSATENFELRRDEDKVTFQDYSILTSNTLYYGYTLTHTVSAQGLVNYKGTTASEAFNEAYKYVKAKKQDDLKIANQDIFQKNLLGGNKIDAHGLRISGENNLVGSEVSAVYTSYNKVRTVSSDIATGSYSITETYFQNKHDTTIEINANFNRDESGDSNVTVEGTVQGLSDAGINSDNYDKLSKAEAVYSTISGDLKSGPIWNLANKVFGDNSAVTNGAQLRNYPMQITVGKNKVNGTVNFNVMYKAYGTAILGLISIFQSYGAISATAAINDNNRLNAGADEQTIVSIPVIGRGSYGPILQDMNVTKDRKRTVTVDVTVEPANRTETNDGLRNLVVTTAKSYGPTSGRNIKIESFSESWDWVAGKCTANIGWIYQQ